MLSHSILGRFLEYPYEAPPPELIGAEHFGTYEARANGNLWADAFANFGAAGMLGFSAVLAVFLWIYDCAARGSDYYVALALLAMPAISLSNSAMLTSILTHGLGLGLVLLLLLPSENVPRRRRLPASAIGPRLGVRHA